ncbi:hypothetical protein Xvie_03939 [Xenorhabdus vietnamensis]|uniref:Uncharacterized protein n=1 Tax=Xenorhabdus vietnamensis TaxID=351656 RepID=A0A1Y2S9E6_9GAMM|nr:hypothetical protein [Xenorhabdus vietnamensis]OTA14161.1 hypothetical protein Xvie_03939 [Xenorhabdus vietnamensis]
MNRFAKVLFSLILVSLPFSGHSFQASAQEKNTHQILGIKIPKPPKPPKPPRPSKPSNTQKTQNKHESSGIKHTYKSIKDAPQYPKGFRPVQDGTTKHIINRKDLLRDLREVRAGKWYKVYKNGTVNGNKVSIHYFQHESGQVFNVKVVNRWSIP